MKFEECRRYVNSDLKRLTPSNKSGGGKTITSLFDNKRFV